MIRTVTCILLTAFAAAGAPGTANPYGPNSPEVKPELGGMPADLRDGYRRFHSKCGQCHSLNLRLKDADSSPQEWSDIVYRMQDMASSHIREADTKAIIAFLVWDSRQHKDQSAKGGN